MNHLCAQDDGDRPVKTARDNLAEYMARLVVKAVQIRRHRECERSSSQDAPENGPVQRRL